MTDRKVSPEEVVTIETVFRQLDAWRRLPAYRLEPRVDVFAGVFLARFLEEERGIFFDDLVIAELPLDQKRTSKHSDKVDFALCSRDRKVVCLVEFKSDMRSVSPKQMRYLGRACGPFADLFEGIRRISPGKPWTEAAKKHSALMKQLAHWDRGVRDGVLTDLAQAKVEVCFLTPTPPEETNPVFKYITFAQFATFLAKQPGEVAATAAHYFRKWIDGPSTVQI